MNRRMRWWTALVGALALAIPLAAGAAVGSFTDDDGNIHEPAIDAIAAAGITLGCNPPADDLFCPEERVTRGQMAAFLTRAFGFAAEKTDRFSDDDGSVFEADIDALATAGVTLGCNPPVNDRFCPDEPVTRGQMAAFLVRAKGYQPTTSGDRFSDDDGSVFEADIEILAAARVTLGCNPPLNDQFCPGRPVTRAEMATFLARVLDLDTSPMAAPASLAVEELADLGDTSVTWVGNAPGSESVYAADRAGTLVEIEAGTIRPVLSVPTVIHQGEQGFVGAAFHPSYAFNGRVFVGYTDADGTLVIDEHVVVAGDGEFERTILSVPQPSPLHNGGMLHFAPDGTLFVGLGDGGPGDDPSENGENPGTLPGSILRIDVDGDDFPADPLRNYAIPPGGPSGPGADEVWAYGLRNPWRFHIDADEGLMYIGDVGEKSREEVNVVPLDVADKPNFGWDVTEGRMCHEPLAGCSFEGITGPVVEYDHSTGCSITGGVTYQGEVTELAGHYFYADFCVGWLRSFLLEDGRSRRHWEWDTGDSIALPVTFGVGPDGTILIGTHTGQVLSLTFE